MWRWRAAAPSTVRANDSLHLPRLPWLTKKVELRGHRCSSCGLLGINLLKSFLCIWFSVPCFFKKKNLFIGWWADLVGKGTCWLKPGFNPWGAHNEGENRPPSIYLLINTHAHPTPKHIHNKYKYVMLKKKFFFKKNPFCKATKTMSVLCLVLGNLPTPFLLCLPPRIPMLRTL